jgi:malto-oligosyltrehalose trehalohydrolase
LLSPEANVPQPKDSSSLAYHPQFGPELLPRGVRFHLWAPRSRRMNLLIGGEAEPRPMRRRGAWFELEVAEAAAGTLYQFEQPGHGRYPDPASRFQPYDGRGWSEVVDAGGFAWRCPDWGARPWHEAVLYELHVGTFTPEGTFRSAIARLDHLHRLGVTAIELMPVADFPGRWNWGYDATLPYAPDAAYGRPDELRELVDAAHQRGMMVVLDVIYNHLGTCAGYLEEFTRIPSERHATPWGPGFNFDGEGAEEVRRYVVGNALYWLEDFRFDGLRVDAIHTIADNSQTHILEELTAAVQHLARQRDRHIHLIAENPDNRPHWLVRRKSGEPRYFVTQWNDELHHALQATASGEGEGAYADFIGRPELLGRALAEGYAYQGEVLPREGVPKGAPSGFLPPTAFVSFIQNHDQIGNRPRGERIAALAPTPALRAVTAIYLLAPQVPLLFMGEEWKSRRPFLFFSDLEPPPGNAAEQRAEGLDAPRVEDWSSVPDPFDDSSYYDSRLDWSEAEQPEHRDWLAFYQALLELRRQEIVPRLGGIGGDCGSYRLLAGGALDVRWRLGDGAVLVLTANLQDAPAVVAIPKQGRQLWGEGGGEDGLLQPWSVVWTLMEAVARAAH